jgi:hypothetical protein
MIVPALYASAQADARPNGPAARDFSPRLRPPASAGQIGGYAQIGGTGCIFALPHSPPSCFNQIILSILLCILYILYPSLYHPITTGPTPAVATPTPPSSPPLRAFT